MLHGQVQQSSIRFNNFENRESVLEMIKHHLICYHHTVDRELEMSYHSRWFSSVDALAVNTI